MNRELLITLEILLTIAFPLLLLYLRSTWPQSRTTPAVVIIPMLTIFFYPMIHELSHVAGTYLAGGRVIETKLFLKPWLGDFGPAWIKTEGITQAWQQMMTTGFPYILDVLCVAGGLFALHPRFVTHPFLVGLFFSLLVLRPAFDFLSELTGFVSPHRGDYNAMSDIVGVSFIWIYITCSLILSLTAITIVLRRFAGFPETTPDQPDVT